MEDPSPWNNDSSSADEVHSDHFEEPEAENEPPVTMMPTMDAEKVAELFMAKMVALDVPNELPARRVRTTVARSTSKSKLATATNSARRPKTSGAATDQPPSFSAEVRCACRVGSTVWAAERDGAIVVRDASSAKVIEKQLPHGWETILCITTVGSSAVWCGTSDGPILIFDRQRKLTHEARAHAGGVQCLCAAPTAGGRGFVVSGGLDRRVCMWPLDGSKVIKTLSGHTGGVRSCLVLGLEIWTGSDDGTLRVWDASVGLFQLDAAEACRAVLSGHNGAVHQLLAHSDGILSCSADGTIRCWSPGARHECIREVSLNGGPIYQIAPMGRGVWAACSDGLLHSLDGVTLEPSGPPRHAHAGFINGLCQLQARTTRQCWSFATSDGKVCRWKSEELEPQHTSERAGVLQSEVESLAEQMRIEYEERKAEQVRHAEEVHAGAEALAQSEVMLEEAREAQKQLLQELANSMDVQERDVREAERLRGELRARDADLANLREQHSELEASSTQAIGELEVRASTAEAEASLRAAELAEEVARNEQREAASAKRQMSAERLARKLLSSYVPQVRENLERRRERNEYLLTQEALTRAGDPWGGDFGGATAGEEGEEFGSPAIVPQESLASTVATSLDEMMGTGESLDSAVIATVANFASLPLRHEAEGE